MSEDIRKMNDKVKNFKQFVNENKGDEIQIVDGFEKKPYTKSFEEQYNNGEIWFQTSGRYNQMFLLEKNNGFIGEVNGMWNLYYKGMKPVVDEKNRLAIGSDGFKNVKELFEWLNPILTEYKKTFVWNFFA